MTHPDGEISGHVLVPHRRWGKGGAVGLQSLQRWVGAGILAWSSMGWVSLNGSTVLALQADVTSAAAPSQGICPEQLPEAIATITQQPAFHTARWGIRVETLEPDAGPPEILYDQEGDRLFIPASNVKLLTTAAALNQLGADFRIRTSLYADRETPDGVVLRLMGRGDSSLEDGDLAELARQVSHRAIRQVAELQVDDRYFQSDAVNSTWEWGDIQAGYAAPVTSVILNQNELRVVALPGQVGEPVRLEWSDESEASRWQVVNRAVTVPASEGGFTWVGRDFHQPVVYIYGQRAVGAPPDESSISIPDPSQYALRKLKAALESTGVRVTNIAELPNSSTPPIPLGSEAAEVAHVLSPTLAELLVVANRDSENIYAEALLRQLGVVGAIAPPESPLDAGIAAIEASLAALGVDPAGFQLADGSGLSRHNLVSPAALVDTLQAMARHPDAQVYRESLAVAGHSGTLQNRFRGTPVEGRLQGKTGGLTGIASLSGYLDPPNSEPLVVSLIVSHSDASGSVRRQALDEVVLLLNQLQDCTVEAAE